MSAPTDRGLALARAFIANIDEWDGEPMPGQRWHKEYTAAKELIRAAEIDASRPCTCPSGDGSLRWPCPAHAEAVEALPEVVAALKACGWRQCSKCREDGRKDDCFRCGGSGWRDKCRDSVCRDHGCDGGKICYLSKETVTKVVRAALAARPAAAGGELPGLPWIQRYKVDGDTASPLSEDDRGSMVYYIDHVEVMQAYARVAIAATQPQQLAVTDEAVLIACGIYAGEIGEVSNYAMRRALTAALPHVVRKGE